MKIGVASVYVDDQEKALRFYTDVLGFVKKADVTQGPFRWLTVASPEQPDGVELQLALNDNPAAKAYQQAMFEQGQPAAMFYVDDVQRDYYFARAILIDPTKDEGRTTKVRSAGVRPSSFVLRPINVARTDYYVRMKAAGAEFTMPPTKVTGSTIAIVNDICSNRIQIAALDRWQ